MFPRSMASLSAASALILGTVSAANYPTVPADLTTPVQQRLAVKGPNSMSVGWNTYEQLSNPCVQYGTNAQNLSQQACSTTSVTYPSSRTWSNAVTLTGLSPSTTYYYKIVSTNSSVEHFASPRRVGDTTPFNMDVVIDMGVYGADGYTTKKRDTIPQIQPELNHTTIGALAQTVNDYEIVLHPGDFGYADDWYLKADNLLDGKDAYEAILETFYDQLAPVAGRKAYMASPGNHEADCTELDYTSALCPRGQSNFTDFMNRFGNTMPTAFDSTSTFPAAKSNASLAQSLANPPFWYSFEYGMVHVTMIDTETDFYKAPDGPDGSAGLNGGPFGFTNQQIEFIAADLASVDRTITPWLIVAGHRPWYSTGGDGCTPCQNAFEPMFLEYGVDLGIFGHVHNSQRFNPIYNGTADPAGLNDPTYPMYIVAGGAGNIEGLDSNGTATATSKFAYSEDFSYATLKFLDAQHLQIDFIQSSTLDVLDSSVLYKAHNVTFPRNS